MKFFSRNIIGWYKKNKRDLPWRGISDPYLIWVSEVILQQTRVNQGVEYYRRFISRFPDVVSLADAKESSVLKLWQGLGYYTRARNMHKASKDIVLLYNGVIPDEYSQLISLSGIGEYTAAAILSIAFGKPYAVIDGNVIRVLSRFFGVKNDPGSGAGRKQFRKLASELLTGDPGIYNQSLMEFGALMCVPRNPNCKICPINRNCLAFLEGCPHNYPVKGKAVKIKEVHFYYLVISDKRTGSESFYMQRRKDGIWKNLYDFPYIESAEKMEIEDIKKTAYWRHLFGNHRVIVEKRVGEISHRLTHKLIRAVFYKVRLMETLKVRDYISVSANRINRYPLPRLIEKYFEELQ